MVQQYTAEQLKKENEDFAVNFRTLFLLNELMITELAEVRGKNEHLRDLVHDYQATTEKQNFELEILRARLGV